MFYWNQDNYQGLKDVGESYLSKEGYNGFANYCLFKEQGLKKKAIEEINRFVSSVKKWDLERKRKLAEDLSSLSFWNSEIHQLIPHPLKQLILEILEDWASEDSSSSVPHRWLGYMSADINCFLKAVEIDSSDEISISRIAQANINEIDYQTHHLSESLFIGDYNEACDTLSEATKYSLMLSNGELKNNLLEKLKYYKDLLQSWKEYKSNEKSFSFPEWCKSKGKNFNFWSIVYYDQE